MNLDFIYETNDNIDMFHLIHDIDKDFNVYESQYSDYKNKLELLSYFNESTEELNLVFEATNQSFLEKIGNKVITLIEKVAHMIDNLISKVTGAFKKSPSENEMKQIFQQHPEYAESFLEGLKSGSVRYCDYQDLNEIIDAAEKATKDLKSGKLGKQSFIQKMNSLINRVDETLQPSAGLLKTVSGSADSVTKLLGFKNACAKEAIQGQKNKRRIELLKADLVKEMQETGDDDDHSCMIWRMKLLNKVMNETGRTTNWLQSKTDSVLNFVDKHLLTKKVDVDDFANGTGNYHRDKTVKKLKDINTYEKMTSSNKGGN